MLEKLSTPIIKLKFLSVNLQLAAISFIIRLAFAFFEYNSVSEI